MTNEKINKSADIADKNFKKLSIQVSLNGLSFCVVDTVSRKVLLADKSEFEEEQTPMVILDALEKLFQQHGLDQKEFDEVFVVHRNTLFALVPKSLFNADKLLEYLKFNTKVLATDVLSYDEVEHHDVVNVYVSYMDINDYIYGLFGEFTYMHNGTVLLQYLLNNKSHDQEKACYVYVHRNQLDITVLDQRKLVLYNSFNYQTKEDFVYYLLFVLEQLDLDPKNVPVRLFGAIEEDDAIFKLCYAYIKHISVFVPPSPHFFKLGESISNTIDFTLINTL